MVTVKLTIENIALKSPSFPFKRWSHLACPQAHVSAAAPCQALRGSHFPNCFTWHSGGGGDKRMFEMLTFIHDCVASAPGVSSRTWCPWTEEGRSLWHGSPSYTAELSGCQVCLSPHEKDSNSEEDPRHCLCTLSWGLNLTPSSFSRIVTCL